MPTLRNLLASFAIFAPFAIIAGMILSLPMYASYILTLDIAAKDIIIGQKSEEAEIAVEIVRRKGLLGQPVKGKVKRRRVK